MAGRQDHIATLQALDRPTRGRVLRELRALREQLLAAHGLARWQDVHGLDEAARMDLLEWGWEGECAPITPREIAASLIGAGIAAGIDPVREDERRALDTLIADG